MGWSCTNKPKGGSLLQFFIDHGVLRWSDPELPHRYTVLDGALVNMRTFYAAVEKVHKETGEREVFAVAILVKFYRRPRGEYPPYGYGHENFCWKSIAEMAGPSVADCPERILKLLTDTSNIDALEWRQRCWGKIRAAKQVSAYKLGDRFEAGYCNIAGPITSISPHRLSIRDETSGTTYGMSRVRVKRQILDGSVKIIPKA